MIEIGNGQPSAEVTTNFIDPEAMLSQFLNYHRHDGYSNWTAQYRIRVDPTGEYYGTWHWEAEIIGNGERLTREEALAVVHEYESQANPETPSLEDNFSGYLLHNRWASLGPSSEHEGEDRP